jgi:hypothetical protein
LKSLTSVERINRPIRYAHFDNCLVNRPFDGILHYIYVQSGNEYNTSELTISYFDSQGVSDPANLLNSHDNSVYRSGCGKGQRLVFNFHRVQIRPTGFAFRSAPRSMKTRSLSSYVFQGWDEKQGRWTVLWEEPALSAGRGAQNSVSIRFVDTSQYFASLQLLDTETGSRTAIPFSLEAFEIHGSVQIAD